MILFTNCKINLGLDIVRRRADGYHDISTCMIPVPWHDVLEIIPARGDETTLTVLGNTVDCPPEKNLVMKAYRALSAVKPLPAVDIVLQKVVPDGAGLGGGSSDAAHTLILLNEMFGLEMPKPEMARIAAGIGADCPFFIYSEPMLCEGIGDIMTPVDIDLSRYTIVIAKPSGVSISTKKAYAGVSVGEPEIPLAQRLALPIEQWQEMIGNAFEPSIFPEAPQIAELKHTMLAHGAVYASMSGSGASVYGVFDNDNMAEAVCGAVASLPHFVFRPA